MSVVLRGAGRWLRKCCTRVVRRPVVQLGMVTKAFVSMSYEKKAGLNRTEGSADAPTHEKELHRPSEQITRKTPVHPWHAQGEWEMYRSVGDTILTLNSQTLQHRRPCPRSLPTGIVGQIVEGEIVSQLMGQKGMGRGCGGAYGATTSRPSSAAILQSRRSDETKVRLPRLKFKAIAS